MIKKQIYLSISFPSQPINISQCRRRTIYTYSTLYTIRDEERERDLNLFSKNCFIEYIKSMFGFVFKIKSDSCKVIIIYVLDLDFIISKINVTCRYACTPQSVTKWSVDFNVQKVSTYLIKSKCIIPCRIHWNWIMQCMENCG